MANTRLNKFRTTRKDFKEQVQNYIVDCLSEDETSDLTDQLQNTVQAFNDWYAYNKKQRPNRQEAFMYWLMCLPSELSVEYEFYHMDRRLESWFNLCGQEYKPRKDYDQFFLALIYREFSALCKKHNIQF